MLTTNTTLDFIRYLAEQGHHQILGLRAGTDATSPHYYEGDDDLTAQILSDWESQEYDIYITGNPVASPPVYEGGGLQKVKARHIIARRRFMVDVDGDPDAAESLKDAILSDLADRDITPEWVAHTGNGYQIIIRLADLPLSDETDRSISGFVADLAARHDTDDAHVDQRVSDLSRLFRLPGSVRFKGGDPKQGSYTLYDAPTVLTLADLSRYCGDAPTPTRQTSPTRQSETTGGLYVGSVSMRDIRDAINLRRVVTHDAPPGYHNACRVECPQGRSSAAKLLLTLSGGVLRTHCPHDKCKCLSTYDHLMAMGVEPSLVSPLYPSGASPLAVRWMAAVRPDMDKVKHDGSVIAITKPGITIYRTYVDCDYRALPGSIKTRIEAPLRADNETLATISRLATRVMQSVDLLNYCGATMQYDASVGGYVTVDRLKPFLAARLEAITAADSDHLREQYGVLTQVQSINAGVVSSVALAVMGRLKEKSKYDFPIGANYSNGIWDAATGRLIPHGPEHFVRPALPFEFSTTATAPKFEGVLRDIYPEVEQRTLALEIMGMAHAGDASHERMTMMVGPGGTGKGLMMSITKKMVSKVATPLATDLTDKNGLTACIGAAMLVVNEAPSLKARQVATLKMITGGDDIQIHRKYETSFNGPLTLAVYLLSNELLTLPDPSGAIMRRLLILIHQTEKSEAERDASLKKDALNHELPGIARMAREAYLAMVERGEFTKNPHVDHLVDAIVEDSSPVRKFIAEQCTVDRHLKISRNALYEAYCDFIFEFGIDKPSKQEFANDLKAAAMGVRGNDPKRGPSARVWHGIALREEK